MAITRVRTIKEDPTEGFDEPFDRNADAPDVRGIYVQNDTSNDTSVLVTRDASDNLTFTDVVTGTKTLAQLISGGATNTAVKADFLLDNEPVAVGMSYTITYSGSSPTNETWTITATAKVLKTITYTYASGKLSTEVRKLFAADGTTVVDQVTYTYTYSGNILTSIASTRDLNSASSATITVDDFLLDNEPDKAGMSYAITRASGQVTKETWTTTATSKTLKTIDYTYTGSKITSEVRKIFATDGTTVEAQTTTSYTYSGIQLTSSTLTRDL